MPGAPPPSESPVPPLPQIDPPGLGHPRRIASDSEKFHALRRHRLSQLASALGATPFQTVAAVVCSVVATAKSLYIMAGEYDVERDLVASTISLTTLGSVASLLLWLLALARLLPTTFHG